MPKLIHDSTKAGFCARIVSFCAQMTTTRCSARIAERKRKREALNDASSSSSSSSSISAACISPAQGSSLSSTQRRKYVAKVELSAEMARAQAAQMRYAAAHATLQRMREAASGSWLALDSAEQIVRDARHADNDARAALARAVGDDENEMLELVWIVVHFLD